MTTANISIKTLLQVITSVSPDITVCIRGRHAIGKSEVVYQAAKILGLPVVERRLSQVTEGDLIGLPVLDSEAVSTSFKPVDWLMRAVNEPVLLFLDERNRALPAVKQSVFQLCDSRSFYGHRLHEGTRIVIAENIGASYQVETNDPAEVSRCATCNLDPTVEEWIEYARGQNVNSLVTGFIQANERCLEHRGNYEPNEKYPDRRSWMKFARECDRLGIWTSIEEKQALFLGLAQMMLGVETASMFHTYAVENTKRISITDILTDWDKLARRLKGNDEMIAREYMVECTNKIEEWMKTSTDLTDHQLVQLDKFSKAVPPELLLPVITVVALGIGEKRLKTENAEPVSANYRRLAHLFSTRMTAAYLAKDITDDAFKPKDPQTK